MDIKNRSVGKKATFVDSSESNAHPFLAQEQNGVLYS